MVALSLLTLPVVLVVSISGKVLVQSGSYTRQYVFSQICVHQLVNSQTAVHLLQLGCNRTTRNWALQSAPAERQTENDHEEACFLALNIALRANNRKSKKVPEVRGRTESLSIISHQPSYSQNYPTTHQTVIITPTQTSNGEPRSGIFTTIP